MNAVSPAATSEEIKALLERITALENKFAAAPPPDPEVAIAPDPALDTTPVAVTIIRPQPQIVTSGRVSAEVGGLPKGFKGFDGKGGFGVGPTPHIHREGTTHEFPKHIADKLIEHGLGKLAVMPLPPVKPPQTP